MYVCMYEFTPYRKYIADLAHVSRQTKRRLGQEDDGVGSGLGLGLDLGLRV